MGNQAAALWRGSDGRAGYIAVSKIVLLASPCGPCLRCGTYSGCIVAGTKDVDDKYQVSRTGFNDRLYCPLPISSQIPAW